MAKTRKQTTDEPTTTTKPPLPDGWAWVKFGDVVREMNAAERNPIAAGLTRFVGLEHLEPEDLRVRAWGNVADGVTFTRVFRAGQVLFGKRRAYQRKAAVPDFDGICSGDILVMEAKPWPTNGIGLLPELLPFIVQTNGFFQHALGTSAGSLSPRTKFKELAKYRFALPSTRSDQQRIAQLVSSANAVFEKYALTVEAAEKSRDHIICGIYECGLNSEPLVATPLGRRPKSWRVEPLGKRYSIQLGKMMSPQAITGSGQRPYMRNANVQWNRLDLSDVATMSFSEDEVRKFELKPGDILACEGRHVGKSAIWRGEIPGACFQKALHRIRPLQSDEQPEFLLHHMRYCEITGRFRDATGETTIPHLPAERLRKMLFAFPNSDEQRRIAGLIADFDKSLAQLRTQQARSILLRTQLTASLLTPKVES